jgi:hypothetical protein
MKRTLARALTTRCTRLINSPSIDDNVVFKAGCEGTVATGAADASRVDSHNQGMAILSLTGLLI